MDAPALIATCRARGVLLLPEGDKLRVRPADRAADLLDDLRRFKRDVLALLAQPDHSASVALDPITIREVFGERPDPHAAAVARWDVSNAVRALEEEIRAGVVVPGIRLILGRPLADWLDLGDLAQLLRLCRSCGGSQ